MSQTTLMLVFHIVALVFLLAVCGFFAMTAALMVGLPVVETWQALRRGLRAAPRKFKEAVVDLPTNVLSLVITGGIALGVIDVVKLERSRADRECRAALRDIHALRVQAMRRMSQIVKASTGAPRIQGGRG